MSDKEDYLTCYREFFENFAATVNPEDQLPVNIAGYTITEAELPGEVLYWTTQYLTEKQCPLTLMTPLRRIILDEVQLASKKHPSEFGYKADESVYIALRLMQAVTARVNDVCLRYLDNSRLDSLPPPPPSDQRELQTVSIANKNSRRVMEDRHVEIGNLEALFGIETTEPTSLYAVYDGHAGSAAATYCAAHLHQYLVESPHFTTDLRRALRDAFLRTDAEFVRKSNQERACGGSTAVVVTVRGRKLLCAWAGDSLALLAKRMRLMQLVRPHKPGRQDERERIEQSGGTVMYWGTWRVNGQLAVSRAIGDAQYKPYVTARPETATVDLDGDEDFVVVACDGLWDFVSEDDVALSVYRQLATDPDDLKAVTKRLVVQAKRQGSADNISIIVVFLKDPRDIAADNCPPMDLGLDNALANAPPFVMETEACKRVDGAAAEAEAECGEADADNGVDNSDSDSEDLGPETAVDADVDVDDLDNDRHNPHPPTPPAHAVQENHVDGGLVDNVAESGEESEDEWNYFKGEGEGEERRREDTPCQDNSAWETSSVDMNSSPLNPDAPVFVPGTVSDVVLAESPRKPVPMDDIELPDSAQFSTEVHVRPAELLDLDNCDQLNGHHKVSIDEAAKEHLNGNEKCNMDSLGFGFGTESDKDTGLIQDFERIQKDTTDFCNIQVFQANTETNPFASESNEELFERLKNKERDPMSMSFYQEKDHDTCERVPPVDLNAVQPLPDSDEDEPRQDTDTDKENISPEHADLLGIIQEPNNDILRFDDRDPILDNAANFASTENFIDNFVSNIQNYPNLNFDSNVREEVTHTDTPESHKLLFEQIPEIPDGKSSELGFANDDGLDPSESDKDRAVTPQEETSQDVDMESKVDTPSEEQPEFSPEPVEHFEPSAPVGDAVNEIIAECEIKENHVESPVECISPAPAHEAVTPQHDVQHNVLVDVHHNEVSHDEIEDRLHGDVPVEEAIPEIQLDSEPVVAASPVPVQSPPPVEAPPSPSPSPAQGELIEPVSSPSPLPRDSPLPTQSPLPTELRESPSPMPAEVPLPRESPLPQEIAESPIPQEIATSPVPQKIAASPLPEEITPSTIPQEIAPSQLPQEIASSPIPQEIAPSPVPQEIALSPKTQEIAPSPIPQEIAASPVPYLRPETASPLTASPIDERTPVEEASITATLVQERQQELPISPPPGPAPDVLPDQPLRSDLVTDIDIGVPESRAQEICLPVSSVIPEPTPPPTPAGAALVETPIAADSLNLIAAAAATAAVAATAAAAVTKAKASPATKKSPTTPKAAPTKPALKTTTPKTPVSAKKPASTPTAKTPVAAKTTPARTPLSAAKSSPKPPTPVTKVVPVAKVAPTKLSSPAAAPAKPIAPGAAKPAPARTAVAKTTTAPRAAAKPKEPAAAKPAPITRPALSAPGTARPAPKPAAPRPAPARAPPPRPAAAPRPRAPADRKPLANGDVKPPAAKPAAPPRPASARPAQRAPASAPAAPTKTAATAAAVPKPLPRAPRPAVRDADKQSKDLANKRLTARAAPPRTAATKAPVPAKGSAPKPIKKPVPAEPVKKEEVIENGVSLPNGAPPLQNGTGASETHELSKAPPPPTGANNTDNALLPDVIA